LPSKFRDSYPRNVRNYVKKIVGRLFYGLLSVKFKNVISN